MLLLFRGSVLLSSYKRGSISPGSVIVLCCRQEIRSILFAFSVHDPAGRLHCNFVSFIKSISTALVYIFRLGCMFSLSHLSRGKRIFYRRIFYLRVQLEMLYDVCFLIPWPRWWNRSIPSVFQVNVRSKRNRPAVRGYN